MLVSILGVSASAAENPKKDQEYKAEDYQFTGIAQDFKFISAMALPGLKALAHNVFYGMIFAELILFGFMIALGSSQDWIPKLFGKIFIFGIVFAVIKYWGPIVNLLFKSSVYIGAKAGMIGFSPPRRPFLTSPVGTCTV
jgi:hypothetical protein